MTELKLISKQSTSSQPIVQNAIDSFVRSSEDDIQKTQQRLREFERKYLMTTDEFIERYENDELHETLEFGEWIGESRMLQGLLENVGNRTQYDNTGHHRKLNLSTFPHHKHDGSETNVIASDAPALAEVLQEIGSIDRGIFL
jgi:ribosomal protein L17